MSSSTSVSDAHHLQADPSRGFPLGRSETAAEMSLLSSVLKRLGLQEKYPDQLLDRHMIDSVDDFVAANIDAQDVQKVRRWVRSQEQCDDAERRQRDFYGGALDEVLGGVCPPGAEWTLDVAINSNEFECYPLPVSTEAEQAFFDQPEETVVQLRHRLAESIDTKTKLASLLKYVRRRHALISPNECFLLMHTMLDVLRKTIEHAKHNGSLDRLKMALSALTGAGIEFAVPVAVKWLSQGHQSWAHQANVLDVLLDSLPKGGRLFKRMALRNCIEEFDPEPNWALAQVWAKHAPKLGVEVNVVVKSRLFPNPVALLCFALSHGPTCFVQQLLDSGADPNQTAGLCVAVKSGTLAMVDGLLDAGADVDAVGPDGMHAALLAASLGRCNFSRSILMRMQLSVHWLDGTVHFLDMATLFEALKMHNTFDLKGALMDAYKTELSDGMFDIVAYDYRDGERSAARKPVQSHRKMLTAERRLKPMPRVYLDGHLVLNHVCRADLGVCVNSGLPLKCMGIWRAEAETEHPEPKY